MDLNPTAAKGLGLIQGDIRLLEQNFDRFLVTAIERDTDTGGVEAFGVAVQNKGLGKGRADFFGDIFGV